MGNYHRYISETARSNFSLFLVAEYSAHYKRRQELLLKGEIPFLSEIAREWGQEYSNMLYENCEESLKYFIGIKPPLKGVGSELWISPSDMLAEKVILKPPPTSGHMKALTHMGVLGK